MGWLGWSADQALHTPVPFILLALQGAAEFAVKTNPFGGGGEDDANQDDAGEDGETGELRPGSELMKQLRAGKAGA